MEEKTVKLNLIKCIESWGEAEKVEIKEGNTSQCHDTKEYRRYWGDGEIICVENVKIKENASTNRK